MMERQNRMIKKDKNKSLKQMDAVKLPTSNAKPGPETRRVIIGGKIKYIPIKTTDNQSNTESSQENNVIKKEPNNKLDKQPQKISSNIKDIVPKQETDKKSPVKSIKELSVNEPDDIDSIDQSNKLGKSYNTNNNNSKPIEKQRVPPSLVKKMEVYNSKLAKEMNNINRKKNISGKNVPSKYAKHIEDDVRKQTVRNVKSFSDLRRVKALQDITPDSGVDVNKASIAELKKMRLEQRKREIEEKRRQVENKKPDSAVQAILNNNDLSKFAKMVAIKNLSVNSRHRKMKTGNNVLNKE